MKVTKPYIIKKRTIGGELSKQYFLLCKTPEDEDLFWVIKYCLVEPDLYERYDRIPYEMVKEFKEVRLYKQQFGIRIETLFDAIDHFLNTSHVIKE